MSRAEAYFLEQAFPHLDEGETIEACGYFRTAMRGRGGTIGAFVDAARARAYFIALSSRKLIAIETRAPATSKPLLENKGVTVFDRSELTGVELNFGSLVIRAGERALALQSTFKSKHFSRQGQLVEQLSKGWGRGESVDTLANRQRNRKIIRLAVGSTIALILFVAGFLLRLHL